MYMLAPVYFTSHSEPSTAFRSKMCSSADLLIILCLPDIMSGFWVSVPVTRATHSLRCRRRHV